MQRDRHFSLRRNGQDLRIGQPDRSRVCAIESRGEDLLLSAIPCGAINNGLAVRRKPRVPDDAVAESDFMKCWIRTSCAALRKAIDSRPRCQDQESRN